jgi:tetratricopeptide (TPR) repeat protein
MKRLALCGLCVMTMLAGCGTSTDELRSQGISGFQVGHLDKAKTLFQLVLDRRPGDAESYYYLGRIAHAQGDPMMAMYYYQSSIDADPAHQEARRWLAKAEQESGAAGKGLRFIK